MKQGESQVASSSCILVFWPSGCPCNLMEYHPHEYWASWMTNRYHWKGSEHCKVYLVHNASRSTKPMELLSAYPLPTPGELTRCHFLLTNSFASLLKRHNSPTGTSIEVIFGDGCSFNQLDLPDYASKEQLQERLLLAIHEGSEGFGFG